MVSNVRAQTDADIALDAALDRMIDSPAVRFGVTLDDWMTRCIVEKSTCPEDAGDKPWQVVTPDRSHFLYDGDWTRVGGPGALGSDFWVGEFCDEADAFKALARAKPYPGAIVTDDASPSMLTESADTRDGEFVSKLAALNADLAAMAMDVGRVHSRNRILQAQCDELVRRNKVLGDAMRRIENVLLPDDANMIDNGDKVLAIVSDAIDAAKVPPMRREVEPDSDPDADIKRDDDRERARDMGLGAHGR